MEKCQVKRQLRTQKLQNCARGHGDKGDFGDGIERERDRERTDTQENEPWDSRRWVWEWLPRAQDIQDTPATIMWPNA